MVCLSGFQSPRVCVKEGEEGWLQHTPALFCFPPTDTPAEIGHPWPTCSLLLTPAHTDLSFFLTDQMPHSPYIHAHASCFLPEKQSQCGALTQFHALQMQTHDFAFSFACLYQITHLKPDCLFIHSSSFFGFYCCPQVLLPSRSFNFTSYPQRRVVLAARLYRESR